MSMVIALLSAMGPLDEEIAYAPYPASVILLRVTKSPAAATAMITGIFIISACSALGCVASVSRLTWAWARDKGLPTYFALVNPKHLLPIRAIWLGLALNVALALVNIGSTTAFGAHSFARDNFALRIIWHRHPQHAPRSIPKLQRQASPRTRRMEHGPVRRVRQRLRNVIHSLHDGIFANTDLHAFLRRRR